VRWLCRGRTKWRGNQPAPPCAKRKDFSTLLGFWHQRVTYQNI
jgi:hypothetical protein